VDCEIDTGELKDEGLRAWVRLSLPLMAGVSLVTADSWIIAHFASKIGGAVSQFTYAKQLFTAPMAVLAQAAGAASMPFFANLWAQKKHFEFATQVADSVSRVVCLGILAASGMVSLGLPLVDLIFVDLTHHGQRVLHRELQNGKHEQGQRLVFRGRSIQCRLHNAANCGRCYHCAHRSVHVLIISQEATTQCLELLLVTSLQVAAQRYGQGNAVLGEASVP